MNFKEWDYFSVERFTALKHKNGRSIFGKHLCEWVSEIQIPSEWIFGLSFVTFALNWRINANNSRGKSLSPQKSFWWVSFPFFCWIPLDLFLPFVRMRRCRPHPHPPFFYSQKSQNCHFYKLFSATKKKVSNGPEINYLSFKFHFLINKAFFFFSSK